MNVISFSTFFVTVKCDLSYYPPTSRALIYTPDSAVLVSQKPIPEMLQSRLQCSWMI